MYHFQGEKGVKGDTGAKGDNGTPCQCPLQLRATNKHSRNEVIFQISTRI